MKMYVIHWKSNVNGRTGTGTKLFDRDAAELLVAELNREYPQIEHEILDAARAQTPGENSACASASTPEPLEMMAPVKPVYRKEIIYGLSRVPPLPVLTTPYSDQLALDLNSGIVSHSC